MTLTNIVKKHLSELAEAGQTFTVPDLYHLAAERKSGKSTIAVLISDLAATGAIECIGMTERDGKTKPSRIFSVIDTEKLAITHTGQTASAATREEYARRIARQEAARTQGAHRLGRCLDNITRARLAA